MQRACPKEVHRRWQHTLWYRRPLGRSCSKEPDGQVTVVLRRRVTAMTAMKRRLRGRPYGIRGDGGYRPQERSCSRLVLPACCRVPDQVANNPFASFRTESRWRVTSAAPPTARASSCRSGTSDSVPQARGAVMSSKRLQRLLASFEVAALGVIAHQLGPLICWQRCVRTSTARQDAGLVQEPPWRKTQAPAT